MSEVAELEDRIISTKSGSITSVQAVYVPADDMTDPAVNAILGHLDSQVVLSRSQAGKGYTRRSIPFCRPPVSGTA